MTKSAIIQIIDIALFAGKTMLENGAETYRVEETVTFMCQGQAVSQVHCFCVPTGIFLSVTYQEEELTCVRRVRTSRIDLEVIAMVNQFSRSFVSGQWTIEEAKDQLKNIASTPKFPFAVRVFFSGVASGFFAMIFGGSFGEFLGAFATGAITLSLIDSANFKIRSFFIKHLIAGVAIGLIGSLCTMAASLFKTSISQDIVIIGGLMPFVPGVAITNALRDTISGDFISGMSKLSEAMTIAVAIAIGVGFSLNLGL